MTTWIEDPDSHHWARPAPEDCPRCECHTNRVCTTGRWAEAHAPVYPDGTPYAKPCPCETDAQ